MRRSPLDTTKAWNTASFTESQSWEREAWNKIVDRDMGRLREVDEGVRDGGGGGSGGGEMKRGEKTKEKDSFTRQCIKQTQRRD